MVNSSWTENHILSLWECPFKTHRVYPPCEVSHLKKLQHAAADDTIVIMSISQFRPEKDHPLQLQVNIIDSLPSCILYKNKNWLWFTFAGHVWIENIATRWRTNVESGKWMIGISVFIFFKHFGINNFLFQLKLLIVGSCRNADDYERLKNMQDLSKHLSLENSVEFRVNISYQELIQCYQMASIGIHTMWNEHFGIGIVECMAAGLIMVANRWVFV